jgi:hypothetical protein
MNFNDAMQEVLQKRKYDFLTGRRVDIREAVSDFIFGIFDWLDDTFSFYLPVGRGGDVNIIVVIFSIIAILLASVAVFVLVRTYLRSRVPKKHALSDIFAEIAEKNYTVAQLLELSHSAENQRTAVRYKYIAAILSLNERDIIEIKPSATNAIILRQIKSAEPSLHAPFSKIADAFHLTWFGHKALRDEDELNSAVDKVVNHA